MAAYKENKASLKVFIVSLKEGRGTMSAENGAHQSTKPASHIMPREGLLLSNGVRSEKRYHQISKRRLHTFSPVFRITPLYALG